MLSETTRGSRVLALAVAAALVPSLGGMAPPAARAAGAAAALRVHRIPLPGRPHHVAVADVSGDGRADLVVSHAAPGGRGLTVVVQRDDGTFAGDAVQTLTVPDAAYAFAVADFAASPGDEIVVLCTDGIRIYRRAAARVRPTPERLLAASGFVDVAPRGPLALWDGVDDLDGDGRADILLPQRAGYLCVFQGRDRTWSLLQSLPVEPEIRVITRSFALFEADLYGAIRALPRLQPADFDGDGRTDLLALRRARLTGFLQAPTGRYAPSPSFVEPVAFLQPRIAVGTPDEFERKRAMFVDLDDDRRADLVVIATEGTVGLFSSIKTAVAVFRGRQDRMYAATPDQVLLLPGAPVVTAIRDLTGDGQPDLLAITVRTDLLGVALAGGLSLTTRLYRGVPGGFRPEPVLEDTVAIAAKRLGSGEQAPQGWHGVDVSGDGLPDRVTWQPDGTLTVTRARRAAGGRFVMEESPWASATTPEGALRLWVDTVTDARRSDVLIAYEHALVVAAPQTPERPR